MSSGRAAGSRTATSTPTSTSGPDCRTTSELRTEGRTASYGHGAALSGSAGVGGRACRARRRLRQPGPQTMDVGIGRIRPWRLLMIERDTVHDAKLRRLETLTEFVIGGASLL